MSQLPEYSPKTTWYTEPGLAASASERRGRRRLPASPERLSEHHLGLGAGGAAADEAEGAAVRRDAQAAPAPELDETTELEAAASRCREDRRRTEPGEGVALLRLLL